MTRVEHAAKTGDFSGVAWELDVERWKFSPPQARIPEPARYSGRSILTQSARWERPKPSPSPRKDSAICSRSEPFSFPTPLPKAGMEIDFHSLPVKGFAWSDVRALRTSAFTACHARSACFSRTPYSCRT